MKGYETRTIASDSTIGELIKGNGDKRNTFQLDQSTAHHSTQAAPTFAAPQSSV